jgi:hypothetical protein
LLSSSSLLFAAVTTLVVSENASAGVLKPLLFSRINSPVPRYMDWFHSTDPYDANRQPAGYSVDVELTGGTTIFKVGC